GKGCLIAIVVFLDVVDKWHQYTLYSDYHIVKYYMIILIKKIAAAKPQRYQSSLIGFYLGMKNISATLLRHWGL
ncbi:hypothetical protein, partial [Salmonella enterica]